jgi:hypothetical protein
MRVMQSRQEESRAGISANTQALIKLVGLIADYWYPITLLVLGFMLVIYGFLMY